MSSPPVPLIAIDARIDFAAERGMARYIDQLVRGVARSPGSERIVALVLKPWFGEACEEVVAPTSADLADYLRRARPDLLHFPYLQRDRDTLRALRCARRLAITVPDLIGYRRADYYTRKGWLARWLGAPRQRKYRRAVRWLVRRSAMVFTFSRHVAGEVETLLGVPRSRIRPVALAAAPCFRPVVDAAAVLGARERQDLAAPYFLYVGRDLPHKNVDGLLRGYARYARAQAAPVRLALVGQSVWGHSREALRNLARELGVAERVDFIDHVEDQDLVALMTAAVAFVFPSLDEGFGLPPLEAMACGAPVISSLAASLPEVIGDAALGVDARDESALAAALAAVAEDPALAERLRQSGLQRAAAFTWLRTGEAMRAGYRAALD